MFFLFVCLFVMTANNPFYHSLLSDTAYQSLYSAAELYYEATFSL